jgi:hypothetical protein
LQVMDSASEEERLTRITKVHVFTTSPIQYRRRTGYSGIESDKSRIAGAEKKDGDRASPLAMGFPAKNGLEGLE